MPSILDYSPGPGDRSTFTRPVTFAEPDETLSFSERVKKAADISGTAAAFLNPVAGLAGAIARPIIKDVLDQPEGFAPLFSAAERQTRLVDNTFAQDQSREEAYDRRIKAVKAATGIELPNPERGGYQLSERERRELSRNGPIDPAAYRRQRFEQDLAAARVDHPDNTEMVFGDIDAEARAIAKGAEADYEAARKDTNLSLPSSLVAELGGGMWGQRRNPIQVIGMLAGPTSAVGKTVAARILSSGLFQGLYNAGLTALEQPSVQAWRQEIGVKSGIVPAAENVGFAFLSGLIPGAIFRGGHEALSAGERAAVKRVMDGAPEKGDVEKLRSLLTELQPHEQAAVKLGEDIDETARATAPARGKDVSPELHDDLEVAATRHGEDPVNQPSAAGVDAVRDLEKMPPEVQERIAAAMPQTEREAQMAATKALEDIGNRQTVARTTEQLDAERLPPVEPLPEGVKPPKLAADDPWGQIPWTNAKGNPDTISLRQAGRVGEHETKLADLIRECK